MATIQLTDSTHTCLLEELDSSKIAVGKHIMHVANNLIMFKHLKIPDKAKYKLVSNGEEFPLTQVPDEITLTCFRIVKNRRGGGKEDLHALQTNLNRNRWVQVGKYKKK